MSYLPRTIYLATIRIGRKGRWRVGREFNVLALIKGEERYVYVYDDASRAPLLETFHTHAADPNLSLNWFDAAVLKQKAHEQALGAKRFREPADKTEPRL